MTGETYVKYSKKLGFRRVRPLADAQLLVRFARDLYIESLGSDAAFFRDFGPYGLLFPPWIARCREINSDFAAFLDEEGADIGLVVLGDDGRDPLLGRVHHFYVAPGWRGRGFGGLLDDYARETLARAGFERARLNVAAGNARARRFYAAQGWRETGCARGLVWMELAL